MRVSMISMALLATLGLAASFFIEASFLGRVTTVQPIAKTPQSDTGWKLVGEPVALINVPESAFVTRGRPGIIAQVDAGILKNNPDAVPYEPVRQTITNARWGCVLAIIFMIGGLAALRRLTLSVSDALD